MRPLIIFDIDGTLIDSIKVDDYGFIQSYKDLHNIDLGQVDWSIFPHVTDWGLSNAIFEENKGRLPTENELAEIKAHFLSILVQKSKEEPILFQEIPGAPDFFHFLQHERYPMAIATGGWGATAFFKLDQIKLELGDVPVAHSDHHFSRKEITMHAIGMAKAQYQTEFSRIVYFGDGKWDFLNCQEMGIDFIGVDFRQNGKLRTLGAQTVIQDFSDRDSLLKIIHTD